MTVLGNVLDHAITDFRGDHLYYGAERFRAATKSWYFITEKPQRILCSICGLRNRGYLIGDCGDFQVERNCSFHLKRNGGKTLNTWKKSAQFSTIHSIANCTELGRFRTKALPVKWLYIAKYSQVLQSLYIDTIIQVLQWLYLYNVHKSQTRRDRDVSIFPLQLTHYLRRFRRNL